MAGFDLRWELRLLGYWQVRLDGEPVEIGIRQQRLISALALLGSRSRTFLADLLWPDSSESQASGNLRASVYRIAHQMPRFMHASPGSLELNPHVAVDVHLARELMRGVESNIDLAQPADVIERLRSADLLPGWYEDWVIFEQERFAQQRLSALETLARRYLVEGDITAAKEAALAAVSIEPLRESAHLLLVRSHLAEGNHATATRVYNDLRTRLEVELGILPSPAFHELIDAEMRAITPSPVPTRQSGSRARAGPARFES